jgi:hypothetical protein
MNQKEKQRAKNVLLEIVKNSSANMMRGKVRFFKTFYFAHLYYAKNGMGVLTDWPIVRMPMGPGIHQFNELISELKSDGLITEGTYESGPLVGSKYSAEEDVPVLDSDCLKAIRAAVEFTANKGSTELSDITHEFSASWNETPNGQELNIYRDIFKDESSESKARTDAILNAFQ